MRGVSIAWYQFTMPAVVAKTGTMERAAERYSTIASRYERTETVSADRN